MKKAKGLGGYVKALAGLAFLLFLLLFPTAPRAFAITISIQNLASSYTQGDTATFYVNVNIENAERLPISEISVVFTGTATGNSYTISWSPDCSSVTGPSGTTVTKVQPAYLSTYSNWGQIYAYGLYANTYVMLNHQYYATGFFGSLTLRYRVVLPTSSLAVDSYNVVAYLYTGSFYAQYDNTSNYSYLSKAFSSSTYSTIISPIPITPSVVKTVGELLKENPEDAAKDLESMTTKSAASKLIDMILTNLTHTVETVEHMNASRAADVITESLKKNLDATVDLMRDLATENPDHTLDILNNTSVDDRVTILSNFDVDQLSSLGFDNVLDLIPENFNPDLASGFTPPSPATFSEILERTPTREHVRFDAMADRFVRMFGSPYPVTKVDARWKTNLVGATATLEDTGISNLPSLPKGRKLHSAFKINTTANEELLDNMLIYFKVEKSWMKSNGVHPWGVTLYRFDEELGSWVSLSTKRISSDDQYVYYVATSPKLSVYAVTGASEPETLNVDIGNLTYPESVPAGEVANVSVLVRNLVNETNSVTVTLWVNDTLESSQLVSLAPLENRTVSFSLTRFESGNYSIRIGKNVATLEVTEPIMLAHLAPTTMLSNGTVTSEFLPGETVRVRVTLTNLKNETQDVVVRAVLKAGDGTLAPISEEAVTLSPLEAKTLDMYLSLPSEASGTWSLKVFSLTKYVSEGGIASAKPVALELTVNG
ncbi:MAG: PGF-pre-PGF domain-containing protein [Thaumarchaeota archaeon]|nr:PGF-pre-PGF domain-containing protein [Nitrososphaerota archaeon]